MRWAFWRKEPEPAKPVTKRYPPPSKDTATRKNSSAPGVAGGSKDTKTRVSAVTPAASAPPPPSSAPEAAPEATNAQVPTPDAGAAAKERLGEMLVRKGFISADALDKALDVQRALRADTFLGEILVRERVLTEEQLAGTISRQYKIPFLRIDNYDIKKEILDLIPGGDARRLRAVPIDRLGRILSVAMVNPLDEVAVGELQQITGLKIKPVICLNADMKKVLEIFYPAKKGSTIVLRRGDTPPPFPSAVPPPPDGRVVPEPVTGRVMVPKQGAETGSKAHPMSAPGPRTILRAAAPATAPAVDVSHGSDASGEATPAEQVTEEVFEDAVTTNPENLLRRGSPQGVRRKAISASTISDAEFVLFVGALPRK